MVVEKNGEIIINVHFCFEESTEVTREDGTLVAVKDLKEGDKILSLKVTNGGTKYHDKVINATVIEGKCEAHKFVFSNGKSITATSPHLMMIWKDNKLEVARSAEHP